MHIHILKRIEMKTILITGASGFLGHQLVKYFHKRKDYKVLAVLGRPEDRANSLPIDNSVVIFPCSALFETDFGHVDTLIHTAFSRGDNLQELSESLSFTENVIELVNTQNIDSIINISSQAVYKDQKPGEKVNEEWTIGPNTSYGLAKWAVENMLKLGCKKKYTNIRMASLSANARFLLFFIDCIINHKDITVTAPHQYASIMDISDAILGITNIEEMHLDERQSIYNLGPETQYSILDYAKTVNQIGEELGFAPIKINVIDNGKLFATCMDCRRLKNQTKWKPLVKKDDLIRNLFQNVTN